MIKTLNGNFKALMVVLGLFISILLATIPIIYRYGQRVNQLEAVCILLETKTGQIETKADRELVDYRFDAINEKLDAAKEERLRILTEIEKLRKYEEYCLNDRYNGIYQKDR